MRPNLRASFSLVSDKRKTPIISGNYGLLRFDIAIGYANVIEDELRKFELDAINHVLERLENDMLMLGGNDFPGILYKYYPDCKVQRSGCSTIKETVDFANCLYQNRTSATDWGPGPGPEEPRPMQDELPPC